MSTGQILAVGFVVVCIAIVLAVHKRTLTGAHIKGPGSTEINIETQAVLATIPKGADSTAIRFAVLSIDVLKEANHNRRGRLTLIE